MSIVPLPIVDETFNMQADLPVITFDFDQLVANAKAMVSKYDGLLITEDQVKDIKKEMAEINAAKSRLDKARKEAVRKVSEPIKVFEAKIKEVCAIFDHTYDALGAQVKEFERKEREEKRVAVQAMIDEALRLAKEANPAMADKLSLAVQDKWLNKTATAKAIQGEIDATIADQIRAEIELQRLEQQKAERRLLIENAVKNGNKNYGFDLPVSQFMTPYFESLDVDAVAVLDHIEAFFKDKAHKKDIEQFANANAKPVHASQPAPDSVSEVTLSIILSYSTAKDTEVRRAIATLKELCTSFAVRKR